MDKPINVEDSPKTQQESSPTKEPNKAIVVSSTARLDPSSTVTGEEKEEKEKEADKGSFLPYHI